VLSIVRRYPLEWQKSTNMCVTRCASAGYFAASSKRCCLRLAGAADSKSRLFFRRHIRAFLSATVGFASASVSRLRTDQALSLFLYVARSALRFQWQYWLLVSHCTARLCRLHRQDPAVRFQQPIIFQIPVCRTNAHRGYEPYHQS
jgi:hypothetical protein